MSLINEALKKAQRQRHDDPAGMTAPIPDGGARVAKRSQPRSAKTVLLLGSGAVVLVAISVVITVYFLTRSDPAPMPAVAVTQGNPSAPKAEVIPETKTGPVTPSPAATTLTPEPKGSAPETVPLVTATPPAPISPANPPKEMPRQPAPPPEKKSSVVETKAVPPAPQTPPAPSPSAPPPVAVTTSNAPPATAPSASTPPATPPAAAKLDERIATFVETLRITGVKASGADSRVLMNDRVYRLNDIIDRNLGLRLIKVEANSLTFSDANGANYLKFF